MSEEILPCPNPECRGECCDQESGGRIWWFCLAHCGYSGPMAKTRKEATRLHNSMPREEPWTPVAEGLPESSWEPYDVRLLSLRSARPEGKHGWTEDGATALVVFACIRLEHAWRVSVADIEIVFGEDDRVSQRVTHYRKHRAPRGPK